MKLTSPKNAAALLDEINVRPSKALGQNFLIDENILRIFLDVADLKATDSVLEIGAGLGTLTERVIGLAGKVTAVEIDHRLYEHLRNTLGHAENLTLVCADAMRLDFEGLFGAGVNKVVGNLPYSVGSRILMSIASVRSLPERITVTVQAEVARRLAAAPDTADYGLLGVWVQAGYEVEICKTISGTCFWPAPRVESAIVNMLRRSDLAAAGAAGGTFRELTKRAFSFRRKQMASLLGRWLPGGRATSPDLAARLLAQAGIDKRARPGELSPSRWQGLANAIDSVAPRA